MKPDETRIEVDLDALDEALADLQSQMNELGKQTLDWMRSIESTIQEIREDLT